MRSGKQRFTLYCVMKSLHVMMKSCLCVLGLWMPKKEIREEFEFIDVKRLTGEVLFDKL